MKTAKLIEVVNPVDRFQTITCSLHTISGAGYESHPRSKKTGNYRIVRGDVAIPLQHRSRSTAECLLDVQMEAYSDLLGFACKQFEDAFKHSCIAHCQDRLSANVRQADAHSQADTAAGRKRKRCDLACDIHMVAGVCTRVWSVVDWFVSGLLAMGIAMRGAGKLDSLHERIGVRCVSILVIYRCLYLL